LKTLKPKKLKPKNLKTFPQKISSPDLKVKYSWGSRYISGVFLSRWHSPIVGTTRAGPCQRTAFHGAACS